MLKILGLSGKFIRMLRLEKSLIVALLPIVGAVSATEISLHNEFYSIFPGLLYGLLWGASFAINDYFDVRIDAINSPDRILPSNTISANAALIWAVLLYVIINLVTFLLYGFLPFLLSTAGSIIGILYSWKLKLRGVPGDLAIFTVAFMGPVFGDIIINHTIRPQSVIIGFFIGCFVYGLQITYSIRDIEGDKAYGSRSIAVRMGGKAAAGIILVVAAIAIGTFYYLYNINMIRFNILLMTIGILLSITGFCMIFKAPVNRVINRYHFLPEMGIIFYVLSFIFI